MPQLRWVLLLSISLACTPRQTFAADEVKPDTDGRAHTAELLADTKIRLRTVTRLKTGVNKKGDHVEFVVDESVTDVAGHILIKKGISAQGSVTKCKSGGSFGRRAALEITIDETKAADGQRVALSTAKGVQTSRAVRTLELLGESPYCTAWGSPKTVKIAVGTPVIAYVAKSIIIQLPAQDKVAVRPDLPLAQTELSEGTKVSLRIPAHVEPRAYLKGETIAFSVDEDVSDSRGVTLIRNGTRANGTVYQSQRVNFFPTKLNVAIGTMTSVDGQHLSLRTAKTIDRNELHPAVLQ